VFRLLKKKSSGQALVEFALILPIFLLLVFGTIEMSRIGYSYVTLNNAVRSGTRVASLGGYDSSIIDTIAKSAPLFDKNLLSIQITPDESSRRSGSNVVISATYPVTLSTPFLSHLLPDPVELKSSLSMRVE